MPKQKKVIEIVCFYCEKKFKYIIQSYSQINRAYCDKCEREHIDNRFHSRIDYQEYQKYLKWIRSQFCRRERELDEINLYIKNNRLFKGEIDLGEIVGKDERFIYVQKHPLGTISLYQKKFIKEF